MSIGFISASAIVDRVAAEQDQALDAFRQESRSALAKAIKEFNLKNQEFTERAKTGKAVQQHLQNLLAKYDTDEDYNRKALIADIRKIANGY